MVIIDTQGGPKTACLQFSTSMQPFKLK